MKKLSMVLGLLAVALFACNDVEQHRATIEGLAERWSETQAQITEFTGKVQGEQAKAQEMFTSMNVPEGTELEDGELAIAEEMKNKMQGQIASLGVLGNELASFVTQWTEKGKKIDEMKAGLESGKIEGDVAVETKGLEDMIGTANQQLNSWQNSLNEVTAAYNTAYEQFMALLPQEVE
jgi:hypothetical protein